MMLSSIWFACTGGFSIDGSITDVTGAPLEGATIGMLGSTCQALTNAEGTFHFTCGTPSESIFVLSEGYVSEEIQLSDTELVPHTIEPVKMVKIPDAKGLFLFDGAAYVEMKPGFLTRRLTGNRKEPSNRDYCLNRELSAPNTLKAGEVSLYDWEHPGWRPWIMDDEDCAYRTERVSKHRMKETHATKPAGKTRVLEVGRQEIVTFELEPGSYFIADWGTSGFFKEHDEAGRRAAGVNSERTYSGYWLVLE